MRLCRTLYTWMWCERSRAGAGRGDGTNTVDQNNCNKKTNLGLQLSISAVGIDATGLGGLDAEETLHDGAGATIEFFAGQVFENKAEAKEYLQKYNEQHFYYIYKRQRLSSVSMGSLGGIVLRTWDRTFITTLLEATPRSISTSHKSLVLRAWK